MDFFLCIFIPHSGGIDIDADFCHRRPRRRRLYMICPDV